MSRLPLLSLLVFPLLALSLALYAQSSLATFATASPFGFKLPLAVSTFVTFVQAQIQAPFSTGQQNTDELSTHQSPEKVVDVESNGHADARAPYSRHIIAVGDIHGDFDNAQKVLQMAGVVDENNEWSGKVDVFVQTGDVIDRGDDTIDLFRWFDELREQAEAVGGIMLTHLGNHEIMNAIGDWRYVYPAEIESFGGVAARQKVLSSGWLGKAWATNYTVASRLPLHPSLGPPNTDYPPSNTSPHQKANTGPLSHAAFAFVHGGLAPTYPDLVPFPSAINNLGSSLLHKLRKRAPQPPPHPPNAYPGLPAGSTREEVRLYGSDGPLWYRGWAESEEAKICSQIDEVLQKTGTRRMIMGHTPNFEHVVSRCEGKAIIIDTGISHAYGGVLSALSITYNLIPVKGGGWKEQEIVKALYSEADDELVIEVERDLVEDLW
ncbi:hypothetical protein SERLA73DRAFT_191838 [Serpula lacrymans var. lacrymans S7.3]|uniref:Calcineurin-like phosphoesterase domain-containing protein n=2 Tax=Serpula lacrymans var. lacrymans TaxID=341189 RepID=F8QIF0_SERL3|nr:uncharacterized protein SERLADRAFT_467811 [Serpula lacrymans var. lacrymans S7.9]EGN91917.1 hypothetical protein SERLA73DRAFT_191838 [Serpula lacrymans var. lacrymans S7.3]EGO24457.1 hypothetical protein SERLADRAFT_467811 [Serpula lacrymans var. lacrymans S7.9]